MYKNVVTCSYNSLMRDESTWILQKPECTFIYEIGYAFPKQVICISYEVNDLGEKRLKESKSFKLIEI